MSQIPELSPFEFSIPRLAYLAPDGSLIQPLPEWVEQDPERLRQAYATMVLCRIFDQKAIALQRTGKLGTYPSILGQEAIGVAIGQWMKEDDLLVPYYRDLPAQYLRGVKLMETLLYWGGDERGNAWSQCRQDLPIAVPIGTQLAHAAGVATAFKIRNEKRAVVASCGDGATSKGDFLESLNLAGAWHLPLVVVINNNQWAISTPCSVQTACQTLAQKAIGAGIPGIQVDGNDYFAVSEALRQALARARAGKGATVIEALSYRLGDHTTADDASRYRPPEALKQAWTREPVSRLRRYLSDQGLWSPRQEQELQERCQAEVEAAVAEYLAVPPEPPEAMFEHLYAKLPRALRGQYAEVRALGELAANRGGPGHD